MNKKDKKYIAIDRAINEFRSGRPIIINKGNNSWIFFTLEHVNVKLLKEISKKSSKKIFACISNNKAQHLSKSNLRYKEASILYFDLHKAISLYQHPSSLQHHQTI